MNREILYRAKRKDNGEWIEGDYCKIPNPNIVFYNLDNEVDAVEVISETVGVKAIDNFNYCSTLDTDAFFEGDILDDEYTVTYDEDNAGLYLKSKFGEEYDKRISSINDERMKLTGNIHDKN